MLDEIKKSKNVTLKMYPLFASLSSDLLFFIVIDTIFLTIVKGATASQIALMGTISALFCILFQPLTMTIIKKFGNTFAVRFGAFLLLISSILYTFGDGIIILTLASCIYTISFFFLEMKVVLLKNNLDNNNIKDEYMSYDSQAKMYFYIYTFIIAFIAGPLFNLYSYLPMFLSIILALITFCLSFLMKDINVDKNKKIDDSLKAKLKINKTIILYFLVTLIFLPILFQCTTNAKILSQDILVQFISLENATLLISLMVILSRASRIIVLYIFKKVCNKYENEMFLLLPLMLFAFISLIVLGGIFSNFWILSYILICVGFVGLFGIAGPQQIFLKNIILNYADVENRQKLISLNYLFLTIGKLIFGLSATLVLANYKMIYCFIFLSIFAILEIVFMLRLKKLSYKNKNS